MLVVDMEFTGLDSEKNSIISLGAVDYLHPSRTLYLECRPRSGALFDDEAFLVHGMSMEYLSKLSLTEKGLIHQFHEWTLESPSRVLMGQAPQLDWAFLQSAYDRYELEWPFGHRLIDSHSICVAHHFWNNVNPSSRNGLSDLGLDKIAQYVGLPKRVGEHNALADAKLTAECFARLLENKNLLPEYASFKIPTIRKKFGKMFE